MESLELLEKYKNLENDKEKEEFVKDLIYMVENLRDIGIFYRKRLKCYNKIKNLYLSYKNTVDYYKQRVEYIQDYLNKYTLSFFDETKQNIFNDKGYDCGGDGSCFTNIPGTYDLIKIRNNCDCQLVKCPNFILCQHFIIPFEEKNHYGLCYPCSIAYKLAGYGKGKLEIFETYECTSCKTNAKCIEQPQCEHILCMDCFRLTYNLGDNNCPICNISTYKVYENKIK